MVTNKQLLQKWESYYQALCVGGDIDPLESSKEKAKRILSLESTPEEWFKYYFPKFARCEPASFHIKATKRLLANNKHYEVRSWSRSLAKSTRAMFEILYLTIAKDVRNVLIISNSLDNATRLLTPFRMNLESNRRLINDYGEQASIGRWEAGEFVTKQGVSFRAVGAGQSPRGTSNDSIRPDFILIDDLDTDEECRNPDRITKKWAWIEEALIPTLDPSANIRILFCGNIIAKNCCITKAGEKADYWDKINIKMVSTNKFNPIDDYNNGLSVWNKNSKEDIDYLLSKLSFSAIQKEYFNNPQNTGEVFKDLTWAETPLLSKFKEVVAYADPATSNKDKAGSSFKALVLVGFFEDKYYILNAFLDNVSNDTFTEWFYDIRSYVNDKTTVYYYIENNSLQEPFFEQVFSPLFQKKSLEKGIVIPLFKDGRKKPDKFARIEGGLEPLVRSGKLLFNNKEKQNPNMIRLLGQFETITAKMSAPADGPDAVEGAVWILSNKINRETTKPYSIARTHKNLY